MTSTSDITRRASAVIAALQRVSVDTKGEAMAQFVINAVEQAWVAAWTADLAQREAVRLRKIAELVVEVMKAHGFESECDHAKYLEPQLGSFSHREAVRDAMTRVRVAERAGPQFAAAIAAEIERLRAVHEQLRVDVAAAEAGKPMETVDQPTAHEEEVLRISTLKRDGQRPLVVVMGKAACFDRIEADRVVVNLASITGEKVE